jgi:hypothetical protein
MSVTVCRRKWTLLGSKRKLDKDEIHNPFEGQTIKRNKYQHYWCRDINSKPRCDNEKNPHIFKGNNVRGGD